jgi:hypothetical protein
LRETKDPSIGDREHRASKRGHDVDRVVPTHTAVARFVEGVVEPRAVATRYRKYKTAKVRNLVRIERCRRGEGFCLLSWRGRRYDSPRRPL